MEGAAQQVPQLRALGEQVLVRRRRRLEELLGSGAGVGTLGGDDGAAPLGVVVPA